MYYMHFVSLLAIFKNETMNLKVWLDHYLWQGVEHFYLIDNGSSDEPLTILQEYIDRGLVTYYVLLERHKQSEHYRHVFDNENMKEKTKWLIVCDLDEFFFGIHVRLSKYLQQMDHVNAIYSQWYMFGSDGLVDHPSDIRLSITHRKEKTWQEDVKYIFQTAAIETSAHLWVHYLLDFHDGVYMDNHNIRINHYVVQSLEYFKKVKMVRGDADRTAGEYARTMEYFERANEGATIYDDTLKQIIEHAPENY